MKKTLELQLDVGRSSPLNSAKKLEDFFAAYKRFYQDAYNKAVAAREGAVIYNYENEKGSGYRLNEYKNNTTMKVWPTW